jgi:hypothetical protein
MRASARAVACLLAAGLAAPAIVWSQEKPSSSPPPASAPAAARTAEQAAPSPGIVEGMLAQSSSQPGYMDAQQVKALLDQARFAEYRLNDLLADVHPERWKISDAARDSFNQTLQTMRSQLKDLDGWRAQFAARPESTYAGFETYATIGGILPRLEGVARTISQADNPSYGAQFSQVADRLFDLQQKLAPYLGFLLNNQDSITQALENNLAGCQNQLGHAMRGQSERPKWIRNSAPVRARRTRVKPRSTGESGEEKKPAAQPPAQKP